jgi:glycosyltransferase involved in cell wall biosynthesis
MNMTSTDQCPLVSIVIPTFNGANFLEEAIESVLDQDYPKIELIVLDDGSTDRTEEILRKYCGKFHWEKHANMGQADTLNKGWRMSSGDILSYLSADDTLLPNAVSASVRCLKSHGDVVLTYCDFNLIDSTSRVFRRAIRPDFSYHDMVVRQICQPGPGVFFWRHAFEATGLWNSSLKQMPDYDYWLRLGLVGRFQRIPSILASFRVHNDSQTFAKSDVIRSEEPLHIISAFFEREDVPSDLAAAKDEALSNAHLVSAQLHIRAGRYQLGCLNFKKAFSLYPRNVLKAGALRIVFNALFNRLLYKMIWKQRAHDSLRAMLTLLLKLA